MNQEMKLHNAKSSSSASKRKTRKRNRKPNALCNSNDSSHDCTGAASLMQDIPLEGNSCAESTVDISSNSALHNAESSSSAANRNRKKRNKKPNALCNSNDTGHDSPGAASLIRDIPQERNPCTESTVDISSNSFLMEAQSDTNLISSENKKKRKRKQKKKRRNASKTDHADVDSSHDCPDGASLKQDIPLERNLCVGFTVDISSNPGLIEAQPNSNLMCSQNKKKRKRKQKKKKHNALQTDNMGVDVQEVASKTMTVLFTTESSVDIMKKTISENSPIEVAALGDTSMKMDLAATPSIKKLSRGQKERMRRKRRREILNALKHNPHHVIPINNSLEKNMFPEKDPSLQPLVDECPRNELVVEQPTGGIWLFNGHNTNENNRGDSLQMPNGGKHLENRDVKLAPKVAELDLTTVKEHFRVSEKRSCSSGSANGSSMEKCEVHTVNDLVLPETRNIITFKRKKEVKTYIRKKNRNASNLVNSLDCIKEDGTRHNSADNLVKTVSVLCETHLQKKDSDKLDKIQIIMQDASHGGHEIPSNPNEDNISGHDGRCEHPKKKNVEAETKMEEIFPPSQLGVIKADVVLGCTGEEENLPQTLQSSPERVCIGLSKKKLLVLDVNGLLADIVQGHNRQYKPDIMVSKKAVYKRPYCNNFLRFCFERFNVGVWSSRIKKNVKKVMDYLMGDSRQNLLFCWDAAHCSETGLNTLDNKRKPLVLKELKKLWEKFESNLPWEKGEYDATNTLLLDDSPYKALCNPAYTAIFPYSYDYRRRDSSLGPGGDLRVYLERLADAKNVQEYVRQHPFGQRPITESHPSWDFYSKVFHTKPHSPHYDWLKFINAKSPEPLNEGNISSACQ